MTSNGASHRGMHYRAQRLSERLALVALSKQDATRYHKSQGDGMWRKACEERGVSGGFYVGDSADDESLARFAGVPFHHVEEFFERMHKAS